MLIRVLCVATHRMSCRGCDLWTALPSYINNEGDSMMQCPLDGTQLVILARSSVEID